MWDKQYGVGVQESVEFIYNFGHACVKFVMSKNEKLCFRLVNWKSNSILNKFILYLEYLGTLSSLIQYFIKALF